MSEVPLNDQLIEIDQLVATARDLTQEPANHAEATPRSVPNEPLFDKTSGVALDELSVRPDQVLFNFHLPVLRC